MKIPLLNRGNIRKVCHKDKETGELKCSMSRVHKDGTETTLAGFTSSVDGDCNVVMTDSFENEEGALVNLEKSVLPRTIGKCKKNENGGGSNIPENY